MKQKREALILKNVETETGSLNVAEKIKKKKKQMRRIDMHAHLFCISELDYRKRQGIFTCFSAGTPSEWQFMEQWRSREELFISFGIHPWYGDRYSVDRCAEYLEACDFIGEIGMDSVWCHVPPQVQQKVLEQQLQIAADLGKPVLLHTKGQEGKIGEIIRDFPGKVCVHWYSGQEQDLDAYLEKDCYFTLGPDFAQVCGMKMLAEQRQLSQMETKPFAQADEDDKIGKRNGYLRILKEVPLNRLFLETDGLSAVAWSRGVEQVLMGEISGVLEENESFLAKQKQMTAGGLQERMAINLIEFLSHS